MRPRGSVAGSGIQFADELVRGSVDVQLADDDPLGQAA
jgi:hypothetical protein